MNWRAHLTLWRLRQLQQIEQEEAKLTIAVARLDDWPSSDWLIYQARATELLRQLNRLTLRFHLLNALRWLDVDRTALLLVLAAEEVLPESRALSLEDRLAIVKPARKPRQWTIT
jgi:hypothetical protein